GLGDLADLAARHATGGLATGRAGALLDAGGLAQEVGSGRPFEDEGEAAVLEDRDLGRDDLTCLGGGPLVVRLAELDDVDAVRTQRATNRRPGPRPAGGH